MNKFIVLSTGGFDPVHKGHIEHFIEASNLGTLIVGLNSDKRLTKKKGKPFMKREERKYILDNLRPVSNVIGFDDDDGTANDAIRKVHKEYGSYHTIVFVKGGDRTQDNIPEIETCKELGIKIVYDIGKSGKIQSISDLLNKWNEKG